MFDQYRLDSTDEKELVKNLRRTPVIERTSVDHYDTLDFCKRAGVLTENRGKIRLTQFGRKLKKLATFENPTYSYELTNEECRQLNSGVFLNRNFDSPVARILADSFVSDDLRKNWFYDYTENPPLEVEFLNYARIMKQSKLLFEHDGMFETNPNYSPLVSKLVSSKDSKLALAELQSTLIEEEKTGKAAEQIVLQYEKDELRRKNCSDEADLVVSVSSWDVAAGFDIKSFDGPSRTKIHDKFIEVKGSKNEDLRFFWSSNEIETAQKLQDKYWLYFVPQVGQKYVNSSPVKFQNPIRSILGSSKYKKEIMGYKISLATQKTRYR